MTETTETRDISIPLTPNVRSSFKNGSEMTEEPLRYLIEGFMLEECGTFFAGLSGHMKTFIALSIAKAFINQTPLFGNPAFKVNERLPVLYLIPESGEKSFRYRLSKFGLVRTDSMFLTRTLTDGDTLKLEDERILTAAEGRVVILDTAIRFTESIDENGASENRYLSNAIFRLLKRGARAVIGLHHSPKAFGKSEYMTLENAVRGSGDIGAMLGTCYAVKLIDSDKALVQIECVKPRDIEPPPQPFQIQGRPYINEQGDFVTVGTAKPLAEAVKEQRKQKTQKKMEQRYWDKYPAACVFFEQGLTKLAIKDKLRIGGSKYTEFRQKWEFEKTGHEKTTHEMVGVA